MSLRFAFAVIAFFACLSEIHAGEPVAATASAHAMDYTLHGFVLADYAARVTGKGAPPGGDGGDFSFAEERGRLELELDGSEIDATARFKLDAAHDAIANRADLDLREAYLDWRAGIIDVRLGRQVLTWGVGDLEFVNDVFPKDYGAFFAGRPIEYLKVPSNALRTSLTLGPLTLDANAVPFFTPDTAPPRNRFHTGFDPFAAITDRQTALPQASLGNTEFAARLYGSLLETDFALYAYRGFFHTPSPSPNPPNAPTVLAYIFPPLSVYGASLQRNLLGGVASVEGGYGDSRDNRSSANPLIPGSFAKWLAGYQREILTDFTVGAQYVGQLMMHYDTYRNSVPAGFPLAQRYAQTLTLRATFMLLNQTLQLSTFAFYGLTERDFMIIPEVEYKLSDHLTVALGANVFYGVHPWTTFGAFADDSNVYAWARFSF